MFGELGLCAVVPEGAVRTLAFTIVPCTEGVPDIMFLLLSITVVPSVRRADPQGGCRHRAEECCW